MVDRSRLANTLLALMVALTVSTLWALGEERLDAYIAMYTLEYTVVKAVLRPARRGRDWLHAALLAAFTIAVGFRVAEVLGW